MTDSCSGAQYEDIISQNIQSLRPGVDRRDVVSALSDISLSIRERSEQSLSSCRIDYVVDFSLGGQFLDLRAPVFLQIFALDEKLCLNHIAETQTIIGSDDTTSQEDEFPSVLSPISTDAAILPEGTLARRTYLPVCFGADGEIEGYLDE